MKKNKTALITGATVGIGYELAKILAKDGYSLALNARNQQLLEQRKAELENEFGIEVTVFPFDLSIPENSVELYNSIQSKNLVVDILINNAGFGELGNFSETDLEKELKMIQLNITSLTILTKLFLKDMLKQNSGKILNIASTAAFQPGPLMAVYYATKSYVLSFSEALWEETKGSGITVTTLCPGPTHTEFQKRAGMDDALLFKIGAMKAEKVARIGCKAMMKGKRTVIAGISNKLMRQSVRFTPTRILLKFVKWFQEKK